MTLKITLKPREKMIIGGAVLINGNPKNTDLIIENTVPVLRQKDILSEKDATSPCSRIYFVIQLMYIDEANLLTHHNAYWKLVRELLDAAPSLTGFIDQINQHILSGRHYQALKLARELITYEQEVISRVH
ncbi:MAG: flagellar biosynthesis repressor FlbT [Desulfobacterales bacterium]|jgi:flagellar protein FlbT|nr:flagellar biosynthesis repressor FlbT [Desulfobacterales bacterium]